MVRRLYSSLVSTDEVWNINSQLKKVKVGDALVLAWADLRLARAESAHKQMW